MALITKNLLSKSDTDMDVVLSYLAELGAELPDSVTPATLYSALVTKARLALQQGNSQTTTGNEGRKGGASTTFSTLGRRVTPKQQSVIDRMADQASGKPRQKIA